MAGQSNHSAALPAVELEFPRPGVACVRLRGDHDLSSRPQLAEALAGAGDRPNVVADLSECTFMDSSVIAAFLQAGRGLGQTGGRLAIVIPPDAGEVRRVADLTGLASVLPVHETAAAAFASFAPQEHTIQVRDLRARFGDAETRAAQCSCGWQGSTYTGHQSAARDARREGRVHVERQRAPRAST